MKSRRNLSLSHFSKPFIVVMTGLAILATSPLPVQAQEGVLEEIVVTARKREQSLQDVPISVQAISGVEIEQQGIIDLERLAPLTPNFHYSQNAGASDTLFMRGIANLGSGPQFEQGVGQVLNGFMTTMGRVGRTNLVDLQQVEVLKGPQGAIIGKNNTLGAINMTTNKPTEEYEFSVSGGFDFDASEGGYVQGIASGPLTDRIRARAVVNYQNRDGWVKSRATGIDGRERDDITTRLLVEVDLLDNLTAELMWQYTDLDQEGKFREAFACADPDTAMAAGFDCVLDGSNQSENVVNGEDIGEPFVMEQNLFGLTLNWDVGEFTVTSLTGFLEYDMFDQFDSSLEPAPITSRSINNDEDFDQFTQEIRISSNWDKRIDFIVGLYYQTDSLDFIQKSDFPDPPGPPPRPADGTRRIELAGRDTDTIAGFGEVNIHFSPEVTFNFGGRITRDERTGFKQQFMAQFGTDIQDLTQCSNNPISPFGPSGFRSCTNTFAFDDDPANDNLFQLGVVRGEVNKTDFSWDASLTWQPYSGTMLYVAGAQGFKSGGFDLRGNNPTIEFVFDDENSTNVEIGGRHTLLDGRLRANWTLYRMNVDGLQVSSNEPVTISSTVINGEATSYGLEYELDWAATDNLNLGLTGAFMHAAWEDFLAPCISSTFVTGPAGLDDTCVVDINGDGRGDLQNLDGKRMPFAPTAQFLASADYTWRDVMPEFLPGVNVTLATKYYWLDDQRASVDANPLGEQDSVGRVDASLHIRSDDGRWRLSVVGRNLNDKIVRQVVSNTTACPNTIPAPGGSGTCLFSFIEQTRAVAVQAEYNFF